MEEKKKAKQKKELKTDKTSTVNDINKTEPKLENKTSNEADKPYSNKVKNSFFGFLQKIKNSFSKKLLYASIIETIYLLIVFAATKIFIDAILPIVEKMDNARKLLASIEANNFSPLMSADVYEVLDAKNRLLLFVFTFIAFYLILNLFSKGFLWQILTGEKFSILRYLKVFIGTICVYVVLIVISYFGYISLREEVMAFFFIFTFYMLNALKNVIQVNLMKYDGVKIGKAMKSYFSPGLLLLPIPVFILALLLMNIVALMDGLSIHLFPVILIINIFIAALVIGWYKTFVLEYA